MARWTLPLLFALAACDAGQRPAPPAGEMQAWINSADQAPLEHQLAAWKGRKAVLLEFSFLA